MSRGGGECFRGSRYSQGNDLRPTRVLIAAMPPLLSQILLSLVADEARVEVVEIEDGAANLANVLAKREVDVVITREAGGEVPERWTDLLFANPRLRLLALSPDARTLFQHRLAPERVVLRDVSPMALLAAICGGAEEPQS